MRLMIIEDNAVLRRKLSLFLNEEAGITVVGAFGSGREALKALRQCAPEVALVDIGLPDMTGDTLIGRMKEEMPDVEFIAHTVFDDREIVLSAIKAGASGYILKGGKLAVLVDALHEIARGGAPMTPKIARKLIREFQKGSACDDCHLSPRETEVLKEIEKGMTYKQIGAKFGISPHTVNVHIKNIYSKLQAQDRHEALRSARKKGIL